MKQFTFNEVRRSRVFMKFSYKWLIYSYLFIIDEHWLFSYCIEYSFRLSNNSIKTRNHVHVIHLWIFIIIFAQFGIFSPFLITENVRQSMFWSGSTTGHNIINATTAIAVIFVAEQCSSYPDWKWFSAMFCCIYVRISTGGPAAGWRSIYGIAWSRNWRYIATNHY